MQMLTLSRPGDVFFWQYEKAFSCSQIYSDSSLKVFQAKGCLAELSLNASLQDSLGHGKGNTCQDCQSHNRTGTSWNI